MAKRKNPPHVAQALRGHATSRDNDHDTVYCQDDANAAHARPGKNQAGAHGPNVQFQGEAMPHDPVKTAPGRAGRKVTRQERNAAGPNVQFQGAEE